QKSKRAAVQRPLVNRLHLPKSQALCCGYRVDSISNPQASSRGSGMYFEFLLRRAHSRSRVERKYWSGESLYSRTTCSNSVMVGVMGPIGSGLPQLGFPRRLAIDITPRASDKFTPVEFRFIPLAEGFTPFLAADQRLQSPYGEPLSLREGNDSMGI